MTGHQRSMSRIGAPALAVATVMGLTLAAAGARAQVLEEIVVTAQKREQSIQDVGIAVTAFTGEQIDALGFESSLDIADLSPGVFRAGSIAGQTSLFTIRGVVQNDFLDSTESPVAVYIDEGYVPMNQGHTFAMFDVERVEILKGPQGTLFGRNATGGLVHTITRKPTREFEAFGDISYGSYDQVRFEGAVSGPLGATLSGRVAGMYNRHEEILDNEFPQGDPAGPGLYPFVIPGNPIPEDGWNDDTWAVRGQVLFEPNEDMEFLVSGFGSRTVTSEGPYQNIATVAVIDAQGRFVNSIYSSPTNVCEAISAETGGCVPIQGLDGELLPTSFDVGNVVFGLPPAAPEDALRPVPGGDLFGYIDADGDGFNGSKDFSPDDVDEFETYGVTAKLSWDFDAFTLTAVSNFMHFDKYIVLDVDAGPVPLTLFQSDSEEDTFAQEVRFNGEFEWARWVAGFYYLYIQNDTINGLAQPANSPLMGTPNDPDGEVIPGVYIPFLGTEANNVIDLETNSYSVFGQLDMDLTEKLTFIAGLRTVIEDKDYDRTIAAYFNTDDSVVETDIRVPGAGIDADSNLRTPFSDSTSDTLWTGKLQLDYRPTEDWLIYVGVNRGVKAGSFNAKIADGTDFLDDDEIPYDEEVLTAYEIGFKSTLFGGTTRFNGAFYYYDYHDYQAFVFFQSSGIIVNNDAKYKGIEFDLQTNPIDGLDLMLSAAFLDAEVTGLEVAPSVFRDVSPSFTPSVQWAGVARYEFPEQYFGGTIAVQMSAHYASNFFHNIRNFQSQKYPSYIVGDARITWASTDAHWEGSVFVDNIADERYRNIGFDLSTLCGCNEDNYGRPRWAGFSLRYRF
jgi:iron complex outermembrane receptor protein